MKPYVIIVAGGKGLRMGSDLPKQFIPVKGRPLLMHTVEKFGDWNPNAEIVLVLPADHQPYWKMLCREIGCQVEHRIVTGGETRFHSVRNGLEAIRGEIEQDAENVLIAVHDGVRPFVSTKVITACFEQASIKGAVVPVLPVVDSLREVDAQGKSKAVDRSRYYAVHTPQAFRADLLLRAYSQDYSPLFTDDASVVEATGVPVSTVPSNPENIKITTPLDLVIAKALLGE
ncbi:MAG TPA: 2-C-methyl-D-erythritol 4-phosphate cytidylyltransferase [Parabacteroides sp.]|nr:2-C-methyl-D-erythritol 4-phosphate cytidylyltransferase [Parabacteroides sp.]